MPIHNEEAVRMLIVEVLEDLGYKTLQASDAMSAIRILDRANRIDLLISDVGLPGGMNGRQLADAVREQRPGLQVLFITGFAESAAVGDGSMEPGMEVLTKPFSLDVLAAKVKAMLRPDLASSQLSV